MVEIQRKRGGRMSNYFPLAVRYPTGSTDWGDREWGARLAGFFFVVQGVLILVHPLLRALRFGTLMLFGALGLPALMAGGPAPLAMALGVVLAAVGLGILARHGWADWTGVVAALFLYVPRWDLPLVAGGGMLICLALIRRRLGAMQEPGPTVSTQPNGT